MYTFVDGIKIELTKEQISKIEREKSKVNKASTSFIKVLMHFGFKQMDTTDWLNPNQICYKQDKFDWFASMETTYWGEKYLFMSGGNLRNVGFPGGDNYYEPKDCADALNEAKLKALT